MSTALDNSDERLDPAFRTPQQATKNTGLEPGVRMARAMLSQGTRSSVVRSTQRRGKMKRILSVTLAVGVMALLAGAALAQMGGGPAGGGMGPGMMGGGMMGGGMMGGGTMGGGMMGGGTMGGGMMGGGTMGPGMMGGAAGQAGAGAQPVQITEGKAKELAQQYADSYLKGFTVEKVLPFTGMHGTMYSVELKGADGQVRTFHINPLGNVMPFGGPQRRSG